MKTLINKPKGSIPKAELNNKFIKFICDSGLELLSSKKIEENCSMFTVKRNGKPFNISAYIKTISNAYLPYDVNVERIQVPHISIIDKTRKDSIFLLCGFIRIEDKDVLACWDPRNFVYHKTIRSAYVNDSSLIEAYEKGYTKLVDHKINMYLCTSEYLSEVIDNYFEDTYVEEI